MTLAAGPAQAAETVIYGPPPAWVHILPIPAPSGAPSTPAIETLLWSSQARHTPQAVERFVELAYRITSAEGLVGAGAYAQTWDPQIETVSMHKLEILRAGQVIDALGAGRKLTVVRREKNLEASMLDGRLTATLQLDGLRVGDIVHIAASLRRSEPVLNGYPGDISTMFHKGSVARLYDRETWPSAFGLHWKASEDLPKPVVADRGGETEIVYDLKDSVFKDPPNGAPARFQDAALLQVSPFADWAQVSALMTPLYARASVIPPQSPLRAEIARIRAEAKTPEARAMAALRLVQDQIRYLYIGLNAGDFTPADADVTWTRRFGDCKGKTALLLGLLHELGVEAQPVLLDTADGDGLPNRLPTAHAFDHVMVRARIDGRPVWLDGTRVGDRKLADLRAPVAHYVLPVQPEGARLEPAMPPPEPRPLKERRLTLDASAGADRPMKVQAEEIFRGDAAVGVALAYKGLSAVDAEQAQRTFWSNAYSWIDVEKTQFRFDENDRVATLDMEGSARAPWSKDGRTWDFDLADTSLGWDASFRRDKTLRPDAPWAVDFPSYRLARVEVRLPADGAGFSVMNAEPIDRTIAGVRYRRTARIEKGVLTAESSSASVAPEFAAAEGPAAQAALYQMSSHDAYLRWIDGPFVVIAPVEAEASPATAVEFSGRGARRLSAGDTGGAIADFDEAVRREPASAKYRYNLGVAHAKAGEDKAALQAFGEALRLDPRNGLARFARGQLRLEGGDAAGAEVDFRDVVAEPHEGSAFEYRIARAYERRGRYAEARRWLERTPANAGDEAEETILAARCELDATEGRDLDGGIGDCGKVLARWPRDPVALEGRGLLRLRQKHWDEAIADFSLAATANKGAPRARTLYGRGVARLKRGMKAEGEVDLAAARAADATVVDYFARAGLAP